MIKPIQKKTAQAIVNIFETGRIFGDYGSVTVMIGDTGHLTYGRSQTTLASGNLALLLHAYCDAGGSFSDALSAYLPAFDRRDINLDSNEKVKSLLRQAGGDPVMEKVQDGFFDRIYWEPALKSAESTGISRPLGIAVIYDSRIHGSYGPIKDMTVSQYGEAGKIGEEAWIKAYVTVRRNWLAKHGNSLLHKTVYRMDSFRELIDAGKWELQLPLTVRNIVITEDAFKSSYQLPSLASAESAGERVLFLTRPMMRGDDVKRLQRALNFSQDEIDGVFGQATDIAVRNFQKSRGLIVDGRVGPATKAAFGL